MSDYSDACINADENEEAHKDVRFKNNALFTSCISRINNTFMNNAEDVVIPISDNKWSKHIFTNFSLFTNQSSHSLNTWIN